ncbi:hypothetical protein [Turicimonas muris]|uniref:hypothetical protein n=1 Tax=Turicimonas muris TaxID=1796652 RepID=UPI0025A5CEF9|nr:hypothetical protein [Turicimonas muris]
MNRLNCLGINRGDSRSFETKAMITILRGIKRMNSTALIFQTESFICPAKIKETIYAPGDIRSETRRPLAGPFELRV